MSPVFAADITVNSALLTAVTVAVVIGVFRGIDWIVGKYAGRSLFSRSGAQQHWTDVTGEVRPVTYAECRMNHQAMKETTDAHAEAIKQVSDSVIELKTDVKTGFASIPVQVAEIIETKIDRHERRLHADSAQPMRRRRDK